MKTLNNVETQDEYAAATTLELTQPYAMVEVDAYNAAIILELLISADGRADTANWQSQGALFIAPSHRVLVRRNIFGIRVRSAVAATPAQVTIALVTEDETYLANLITAPTT